METLPTGISVLDREFGGGLPSGSVVVLKADPASQSELIVDRFSRPRACRYLTTVRSADAVKAILTLGGESEGDGSGGDAETVVEETDREDPIDDVLATASDLPEGATLVVDSVEPLEAADRSRYGSFLTELRRHVDDAGGIAVVHAFKGGNGQNRVVTEQVADVIFDLRTTVTGTEIVNRLIVPKFRGGAALEEPLKLKLTDTVSVDTSRDIA
ncbi:RAD55 family ATPase [Halorubrum lacusprofundi]|jgi:DNA repair protein RadA/Sms|uniref:KaiC-like transcriptional regulator n=1 Tax=Halorubrum lacusprofundi (strain ATCC 49239 / DSM 5036 / JCM 8891 / ACAM 34) TaxID=416348 RepID=B9LUT0_HALLT|nr:circadian clock protein KaiC [Halorubrum lacusprofundi]ACM56407.1 KaiC-like transcriptional regulator [Halorubrum lacusprofundi ATCC 49239]MCG1005320.1 transcriptional regulator [Halorubrum lacusprofundi]